MNDPSPSLAVIDCACELAAHIEHVAAELGEPCTVQVGRSCYEVTAPAAVIRSACRDLGIKWGTP
jgi:hypothetical protein